MSVELTIILAFVLMLLAFVSGAPLVFGLAGVGLIVGLVFYGPGIMFMVTQAAYMIMLSFVLVAVPLFIFMGSLLRESGIAEDLFKAIHHWFGPVRGGLAIGSVIITSKDAPQHMRVFTDRDLLTSFLTKGKSLMTEVGKASSSPLITARLGTSIHETAVTMTSNHIRRLPITKKGELVGIITARDLVEAYAK